MTAIEYTWEPDPLELASSIWAVSQELENTAMPLAFAAEQTTADIKQHFLTETDPHGNPWAQWSPSYAPRALAFPNEGILRRTTDLYRAATDPGAVVINGDTLFYDATGLPPYGKAHQEGRPDRKAPLPQREFLGLSKEAQAVIDMAFIDWFNGAIDLYPTTTGKIGRRHAIQGIHPLTGHAGFIPRETPMPARIG